MPGRPTAVEEYLRALAAQEWSRLGATLAPGVERIGPYGDVHHGREGYVAFLAETVGALRGYTLHVERLLVSGDAVVALLSEGVDTAAGRRTTAEAVVFDLDPSGRIAHVSVFLRRSVTA